MASFTQSLSETISGRDGTGDAASYSRTLSESIGGNDDPNTFASTLPNAKIQWPEGNTLFEVNWRAISEALGGNGIIRKGDLKVEADSTNDLQLNISPGSVYYEGDKFSLNSQDTVTLNSGDSSNDRWDTVVFDASNKSVSVIEGTPSSTPEPPDVQGGQILLAVVYIPANATNISNDDVLNWRAHALRSAKIEFSNPNYTAESVQDALDEAVSKFLEATGDSLTGTLDVSDSPLPISVGTNSGAFGALVDMTVDSNASNGSEQSYSLSLDGSEFIKLKAESDGNGNIKNLEFEILEQVSFNLNEATDFVLENVSSVPSSGNKGRLVFDTNEGFVKVDDGDSIRRIKSQVNVEEFSADESGTVTTGNSGIMYVTSLPNGETLNIRQAGLLLSDGSPAPTGLDLIIATLDNAGSAVREEFVITGDGTVKDDEIGSPLASYSNTSGDRQTVALLVDNGNFNSGSGSDRDIIAVARGEVL